MSSSKRKKPAIEPCGSRWERLLDPPINGTVCSLTSAHYVVRFTGGSVIVSDRASDHEIIRYSGFHYLYTGDISPDETAFFALENGKHFYVFSLTQHRRTHTITLPRGYEALDVWGEYSRDGKRLRVPVIRWANDHRSSLLCEYETESYSLISTVSLWQIEFDKWRLDIFT